MKNWESLQAQRAGAKVVEAEEAMDKQDARTFIELCGITEEALKRSETK